MAAISEACMMDDNKLCNYKQPNKNLCVSSKKFKQNTKDSLWYSESISVDLNQTNYCYGHYGSSLMTSLMSAQNQF